MENQNTNTPSRKYEAEINQALNLVNQEAVKVPTSEAPLVGYEADELQAVEIANSSRPLTTVGEPLPSDDDIFERAARAGRETITIEAIPSRAEEIEVHAGKKALKVAGGVIGAGAAIAGTMGLVDGLADAAIVQIDEQEQIGEDAASQNEQLRFEEDLRNGSISIDQLND